MPASSLIAAGEDGQQLVTFSDYNNGDDDVGNLIETNVFQEQTVGVADACRSPIPRMPYGHLMRATRRVSMNPGPCRRTRYTPEATR